MSPNPLNPNYNFFVRPSWRWERAEERTRLSKPAGPPYIDDAWVEQAVAFLSNIKPRSPTIGYAHQIRVNDDWRRWELESRLLLGCPFTDVALQCRLPPEVVEAYHNLFFSVHPRLSARDWISARAIGGNPLNNFAGKQPATFWKWAAYCGGALILDLVIAVTLDRPLPEVFRLQGAGADEIDELYLRMEVKFLLAIMTAQTDAEAARIVAMRRRVAATRANRDRQDDDSISLLILMEQFLKTVSSSSRQPAEQPGDAPSKKPTGSSDPKVNNQPDKPLKPDTAPTTPRRPDRHVRPRAQA